MWRQEGWVLWAGSRVNAKGWRQKQTCNLADQKGTTRVRWHWVQGRGGMWGAGKGRQQMDHMGPAGHAKKAAFYSGGPGILSKECNRGSCLCSQHQEQISCMSTFAFFNRIATQEIIWPFMDCDWIQYISIHFHLDKNVNSLWQSLVNITVKPPGYRSKHSLFITGPASICL
jgi:hypothetical protein